MQLLSETDGRYRVNWYNYRGLSCSCCQKLMVGTESTGTTTGSFHEAALRN